MITIDDFKKIEIRIGKVVSAEFIPDSDKLLKLIVDMGNENRQILAGIAKFIHNPQELVGKEMPFITNLEPRNMMGLDSNGMLLAINNDGNISFLHPDREVIVGSIVK